MTDMEHIRACARQNPKRANEHAIAYVQRLAVLAGLITPEQTAGEPKGGWSSAHEALEEAEPWHHR